MSIPRTSTNQTHNINLVPPPPGTRTTIMLEHNIGARGVQVTTESTIISEAPPEDTGIFGCIIGYFTGTWAAICDWFLYVFHFFFPPSPLSAITQVALNMQGSMERSQRDQRDWMVRQAEQNQRALEQIIARGVPRPADPPVAPAAAAVVAPAAAVRPITVPVEAPAAARASAAASPSAVAPINSPAAAVVAASSATPSRSAAPSLAATPLAATPPRMLSAMMSPRSPSAVSSSTSNPSSASLELAADQNRRLILVLNTLLGLRQRMSGTVEEAVKRDYEDTLKYTIALLERLSLHSEYSQEGSKEAHTSIHDEAADPSGVLFINGVEAHTRGLVSKLIPFTGITDTNSNI